ncbi:hypothetical protein FGG08_003080 [Glutinoglossum americanum]|uniref:aspartyl aminopeptidase n=1 Tax=Glutinoglossum americanum TaxID=1670608 RepID=A0A9P8I3G7_9PEZI|nr:hypothetical protein FGG08_003080 [Glutinoglossum americanum]
MPNRYAENFLSFVNDSPTPFHAVHSAKKLLGEAGFTEVKPGGPIAMIGAHTDSPCLRVKPISKKQCDGFLQVGVETYGGGIWHTWFDRDLSIAGRAMVKTKAGNFESKLIKVDRPILRIPTLAIHLDRQEAFSFNKENQLFPIAGLIAAELNRKPAQPDIPKDSNAPFQPLKVLTERHHPAIVEEIAGAAGVKPGDVVDFEALLYDTQKSVIGGINNELIFSARLDNLMMSFCSVIGLLEAIKPREDEEDSSISLVSLFDHEEIGSKSAQGADSNLLPSVIRRLSVLPCSQGTHQNSSKIISPDTSTAYEQTLSTSFLVSADMAHGVHPNYAGKYESDHRPEINQGTVIKVNANARYATNSPGIVLLQEVARRADDGKGVPLQLFVVRNDSSCGSTIGPMLSAAMGARTLDLGNPQLSMHSVRETGGAYDIEHAVKLFQSFFVHYAEVHKSIIVE